MNRHFDVIVMGLGGVGSAAAAHLAHRGLRVLGLDQFAAVHDRGSSHGQTRAIRQAYFEDPAYVPLLRRAYELWSELENEIDRQLFFRVGLLEIGSPEGPLIRGVLRSAREHDLRVELLDRDACVADFPQFHLPPESVAVWETNAGYLLVEECVRAHLECAQRYGAELVFNTAVQQWTDRSGRILLQTRDHDFEAERLIVTTGPWLPHWLSSLSLQILQKQVYWFPNFHPRFAENCPVYLLELPHGLFYGFPAVDNEGVKVGEHTGGARVGSPLNGARPMNDPVDEQRVCRFVASWLAGVEPQPGRRSTCWYTMSPDGHFRINRHPACEQVVYVAGLSGHGFKFTPVLGEIIADLAIDGTTPHPIEPFR